MSSPSFTPVALFGGAIRAAVPQGFRDAADFRQVPDTQEVYVCMEEGVDISVVIDLTQRVQAPTDLDALDTHFKDVADDQGRSFAVVSKETVTLPKMADKPTYMITGTTSSRPSENPEYFIGILMALVRLPEQTTDIIVTVNVPFNTTELVQAEKYLVSPRAGTTGGGGEKSEMLRLGMAVLEGVLRDFEILDWGLFLEDVPAGERDVEMEVEGVRAA
ncbi:Mog1p/PsbP-like protein [Choiromyces venosus 120613-1]|uniref:Mog1p/PsbP-like protein n=1 Tax=Choiromyces venosus 120613-1 TaxID=1336337 RepID=A0A3N4J8V9_9PEZI|nr:Mog1p/PsbP-like protein [Choiromyces venosus 120613-1]